MPQKTGTYGIADLLASRFTSAKQFGLDTIARTLQDELNAHNALTDQMIMDLAEPTTDAQSVYGSAAGGTMIEVDEFGGAPTQKPAPGSTVGFPLRLFQFNVGWTYTHMLRATPADMAIKAQSAQVAHLKALRYDIQRAIYSSANLTFTDHLVDNIAITVRRFLNADGETIPAGPNGESFDGATETHYTAEASLTAAGLRASIRNVVEKGHGGRVITAINLADQAAVEALVGFVPYVDTRLIPVDGNPVRTRDMGRIDNRAIGIFDAAEVWVKPWAVANYAVTYDAAAAGKPLKYRQEAPSELRGLRLASENEEHPLFVRFMEARFGFGVWTRTNGAVHQFNNGTYADPTLTMG